jgi:SAM-dependent methyltransferase
VTSVEGQASLASSVSTPKPATPVQATTGLAGEFTKFVLEYAAQHRDRPVTILQAGCATAGSELSLSALGAAGHQVLVSCIDDDSKAVRAAIASHPELASAILGEMRSAAVPPRSYDIVQCSMLLNRISHAELVLDRLVGALRPGGLLLLRTADRDSAAGFLDRRLPGILRSLAWHAGKPGQAGPFPAVYEPIASAHGIQAFVLRHGLVVAHWQSRDVVGAAGRPLGVLAARRLVSWLSMGRLDCDHDELYYVVRKPEDPFARVLP